MEGKNLIVRETKNGRVVDFLEGKGYEYEEYRRFMEEGKNFQGAFKVEATDDTYTYRWGKWWISSSTDQNED